MMPEISRFQGLSIHFYSNDHNPPHFHVKYNEFDAQICIESFRILHGELPPKAMGLIMEWAALHKSELLENWNKMKRGEQWNKIEPLK